MARDMRWSICCLARTPWFTPTPSSPLPQSDVVRASLEFSALLYLSVVCVLCTLSAVTPRLLILILILGSAGAA